MTGETDQKEEAFACLEQAVDHATILHYDSKSEETLMECAVCGEWEGHKEGCVIPVIEKFLKECPW